MTVRRHDATSYEERVMPTTYRRSVIRRLLRVFRTIIGAPDYDAYLEHCRAAGHAVRLTKREYVREFFDNKGHAPRCC